MLKILPFWWISFASEYSSTYLKYVGRNSYELLEIETIELDLGMKSTLFK